MVDYIKSGTAGTTNLAAPAGWTAGSGFPSSVTADTATWLASGPLGLGGTLTGNISTRKVTVNEASANISHSGTITLGTDGFEFAPGNLKQWYQTGVIAIGATTQTWRLSMPVQGFWLAAAGSLTGTAASSLTLISNAGGTTKAYLAANGAFTGFLGTLTLSDYMRLIVASGATSGAFTGASNIIISGVDCSLETQATGTLGAAGKQITINADVSLGVLTRSLTLASNVVLNGTRTLTVAGNTDINGTVTGSNGVSVNMTDTTVGNRIRFAGASNGLTGPCTVEGNRLGIVGATASVRYVPSALTCNSGGEFNYTNVTEDFTFPVAPTGVGAISIIGSFAGTGCTFSAGLLDSFTGRLVAWSGGVAGADNLVKMVINQVAAGGLEWRANAASATTGTGRFTYANAANVDGSFPLLLDTYLNTTPATLLTSEYSLIVPSSSGTFKTSGTVTRQNSIGTTSARMSLTLGGTNTGDNTLSGVISEVGGTATLGITKQDAGRWVLSGTNTYTGVNTISAGTLSAQSAAALGAATSTGGVTISGTGALELAGDITLNKSVTDFTVSNATNPIQSVGDNTLQTKLLTLSVTPTFTVTTGNKLTLTPFGAGKITGAQGIAKSGDGTLSLSAQANDFIGGVVINAGVLEVGSVANANSAAAWGRGDSNPTVANKGTLRYTGSGGSTTRTIRMDDAAPTLESSGSGALTVETLMQNSFAGTRDLTLGGSNEDDNEVTSSINDNGGTTNLVKAGAGKWVLSGALSYGGTTTVSDGTLRVKTTNNNSNAGAVTIASSATVELVTDTLASTSTGQVLGAGDVTVNGGTIKTRGGVVQKGTARYGNNLTFNSGSKLYIGAAA